MIQEYVAVSNWASINRILFVSNTLPITREYYPFIGNNGSYLPFNESKESYEGMTNLNIICSFLFASTRAGDFRTNIVYSSPTVDNADTIDMTASESIREIDIEVMWSDKFGNIFPIRLGPNKQVNIRFAFIEK